MIYNPYTKKQMSSGYSNHPGTVNQSVPQQFDPRQTQVYPQQTWTTPGYNSYSEAIPYSEEEVAVNSPIARDKQTAVESKANHKHHEVKGDSGCKNLPLAQIYVRPQTYQGINSPTEALKQWTAFPELARPYVKPGKKGGHRYE